MYGVAVKELPPLTMVLFRVVLSSMILLVLFHLGIRDIRSGPSLPAFLTPNVLNTLVKLFGIKLITTPGEDLVAILK